MDFKITWQKVLTLRWSVLQKNHLIRCGKAKGSKVIIGKHYHVCPDSLCNEWMDYLGTIKLECPIEEEHYKLEVFDKHRGQRSKLCYQDAITQNLQSLRAHQYCPMLICTLFFLQNLCCNNKKKTF